MIEIWQEWEVQGSDEDEFGVPVVWVGIKGGSVEDTVCEVYGGNHDERKNARMIAEVPRIVNAAERFMADQADIQAWNDLESAVRAARGR